MIIIDNVIKFCKEDPSLIENYEKAVNDKSQTYDIHHRLELDENKTRSQLKAEGRYYNRPASELIFLTHAEHIRLHSLGEKNPMYGRVCTKNMTAEQIEKWRANISKATAGEKHPMYGKHQSEESNRKRSEAMKGYHRVYENEEHAKWHMEKNI